VLCGRDAVQVRPTAGAKLDLATVERKLLSAGVVSRNEFFVRCALRDSSLSLIVFPDGRAMVHGTSDKALARSTYARYVGA
jgi:adenylyltransferase/sulfurtransferase